MKDHKRTAALLLCVVSLLLCLTGCDGNIGDYIDYIRIGDFILPLPWPGTVKEHTGYPAYQAYNDADYAGDDGTNAFQVGFGRREITPPLGTELCGYGYDTPRAAASVRDPLHVVCCTIKQGDEEVMICSADICNMGDCGGVLREAIAAATGIPTENIYYCATHTHSGPYTYINETEYQLTNPTWILETLVPMSVEAALEAQAGLTEAEMGVGNTQSKVAINRRYTDKDGSVVLWGNLAGPYDSTMTVISFRDKNEKCIGNIIHYGCHNTAAGKGNEITRDWCGIMKDALEKKTGGITMFLNGCEGDCAPRFENRNCDTGGDIKLMPQIGNRAAADASAAWDDISVWRSSCELVVEPGTVTLPYEPLPTVDELDNMISKLGKSSADNDKRIGYEARKRFLLSGQPVDEALAIPTTVIALGNVAFVPSPFECFTTMTTRIKDGSPFTNTLMVSQTNDRLGYLPTGDEIARGGYEVRVGYIHRARPFVTDADQHYVNDVLNILNGMK